MSREALDRWCERSIFALVLAILVLGPLAFGAVPPPAFLTIQTLTLGVMLLWGARLWLQPRPQLLWPPITWVVIAFAVYAIARYLTADIEYVARLELIRVLVYAFLFLAILNTRGAAMTSSASHMACPAMLECPSMMKTHFFDLESTVAPPVFVVTPPVFMSANLDGGDAHNQHWLEHYRGRLTYI